MSKTPEILIIDDEDDEYDNDPEIAVLTKDIPVASISPPSPKKRKGDSTGNKSDQDHIGTENGTRTDHNCMSKVKNGYNNREPQNPSMSRNNDEVVNHNGSGEGAAIAATSNHVNGRASRNSNENSNDDDDDDDEQQPITQLPQPSFERQFRSSILKPLHSILDCNTQDETLSMVRMQLFIVMQGLYLEAKRVYGDSNAQSKNIDKTTASSKKENGEACNYNGGNNASTRVFEHNDDDVLTAPGLYIPGEDNVYEFSMSECSFADPDAEAISKKKLLPQVIKVLLKLGDGGGDRNTRFGESYLSVVAEDLVASILLDFVGMVSKILSLINFIVDDNGADDDDSSDNYSVEKNINGGENDCNPSSKKRRRIESSKESSTDSEIEGVQKTSESLNTSAVATNGIESLPNILDFIGCEILSIFSRVLGSEACYAGYNQSLRLIRQEDISRETTVDDVVHTYLPSFFKSHPFDDISMNENEVQVLGDTLVGATATNGKHHYEDTKLSGESPMRDYYLSPLRTGEWRNYFILYHSNMHSMQDLKSIKTSSSTESRDDPPPSTTSISRHLVAMARYFVKMGGIEHMNNIVASGINNFGNTNKQMKSVNLTNLQTTIVIFRSISFISSYTQSISTTTTADTDCLNYLSTMSDLIKFRSTMKLYMTSIIPEIQNLSQSDLRTLLDILSSIEERSLTEDECMRLHQFLDSSIATISPYLDLIVSESSEIKLSVLWKLFTGQNSVEMGEDSLIVAPSLQCQILALNEVIGWLKNLENMIRECHDRYVDVSNTDVGFHVSEKLDKFNGNETGNGKACSVSKKADTNYDGIVTNKDLIKDDLDGDLNKDNESTEVCYNSNDSISSTNTDVDNISNYVESNRKEVDSANDIVSSTPNRGALSYNILQASEDRLIKVLDMLKTRYNMLGHLFSPLGLHSELLKRTLPLLEVFARNNRLKQEDIKMIWDVTGFTSCEKLVNLHVHGSVTSAVFELMLGLLNANNTWMSMGSKIISYFGKLFLEVRDRNRWTRQSLALVESVAQRSIDLIVYETISGKTEVDVMQIPVGVDLLWLLSQDEYLSTHEATRKDSADIAFHALLRVFESVMTRCIQPRNNVEMGQSTCNSQLSSQENKIKMKMQSIQTCLIKRAIESFKSSSKGFNETSNIRILHYLIMHLPLTKKLKEDESDSCKENNEEQFLLCVEDIAKNYDLVSMFTDEMVSYASSAQEKLLSGAKCDDIDNSIIVGSMYTHKECVFYRQQLFQLYVTKSFDLAVLQLNMPQTNPIDAITTSVKRKRDDFEVDCKSTNLVEEESQFKSKNPGDSFGLLQHQRKTIIESSNTPLLPTQDHITQIWEHFVFRGESISTADCVIEMMYFLLTSMDIRISSSKIFEWRREMTKALYPLCSRLDVTSITVAGYKLLIYCLGHVNALEGQFETIPDNTTDERSIGTDFEPRAMSNILLGLSHSFELKLHCASSALHICNKSLITKISSYRISGLDILWSITLGANNQNVANMSMTYIAVLYNYLQSCEEKLTEQVVFVQKCIAELKSQDERDCSLKRKIRILRLVKLFVQYAIHSTHFQPSSSDLSHGYLSEKINSRQVEDMIGVSLPFSILIQVLNGPKFTVPCPLGKNTKIAFVRDSIIRYFSSVPQQDFRLIFSRNELKDNSATLGNYEIKSNSLVFCCPRLSTKHLKVKESVHVVEDNKDIENEARITRQDDKLREIIPAGKEAHLPRDSRISQREDNKMSIPGVAELLSSTCMKTLFSLLSQNMYQKQENMRQLRELVWHLLQLLPTEPSLQQGIHSMVMKNVENQEGVTWAHWLPFANANGDSHCILFRILYSLQVVERVITNQNTCDASNTGKSVDACEIKETNVSHQECNRSEKHTVVVIDDDEEESDDSMSNMATNNKVGSRNTSDINQRDPIIYVKSFVSRAGLQHLVNLFISLNDYTLDSQYEGSKYRDHEKSSLTITCANKLIFLIITLTNQYEVSDQDPRISLVTSGECSPFFIQLLKVIHWAISFQLWSTKDESKSSKYITGGWSSAEIGGALALQCVSMIKILTTKASQIYDSVQFIKPSEPHVLADAISSSIVNSPSQVVRTSSLPVFKQLLFLHERERKRSFGSCNSLESSVRFHSPSLSVLVALLPVGRKTASTARENSEEVSSRCSILFDLVISYISNTWSQLTTTLKQQVVDIFKTQIENLTETDFEDGSLSNPPHIEGIDELGILIFWVLKEFKFLIRTKDRCDFGPYVEGLLSLIQSVILLFPSEQVSALVASIKISQEQNFLDLLYQSGTFHLDRYQGNSRPRFTTPGIRKQIMNLIKTLCKGTDQNLEYLFSLILSHLYSNTPRKDLVKDWAIDPLLKQKSVTGHVGLKNQGATCYLNSLLQQFFHIPTLRLGLLSCELNNIDESSEERCLLFELQRLFGNLLLSEKRDVNTVDLTKLIRGYDGNPVRPGEQQDVDEFFNLFCDRLETALKDLPQKRLLHDVFGGQLSHLITCQECHFSSERIEDFLSISLDVKGKRDIYESLQSYIRGEVLDGSNKYFCSKCNAKRDSIKRCCIKALPNVLICHLKRFDFDLEMLRKVKVNDRFEYPTELDLRQYTKEGLDKREHSDLSWRGDNYYRYTLRGVLVHTGTADSGHYYSLSHVRNYGPLQNNKTDNESAWFCFNDSIVSPFDPSTLEISTFGGSIESNNVVPKRFDSTKSYSAYLLIYDRVDQYAFDEQLIKVPQRIQMPMNSVDLGRNWANGIAEANLRHAKDQVVFSPDYGAFITDICKATLKNKEASSTLTAIKVLTVHLIENLVHVRDRTEEIEKVFSILFSWYRNSELSCQWLLGLLATSHKYWVEKIFLHCYKSEIRKSFINLLEVIFQTLSPLERDDYYTFHSTVMADSETQRDDGFDSDGDTVVMSLRTDGCTKPHASLKRVQYWKSKSTLVIFIGTLFDLIDECGAHWRRFDQIFECLKKFASCGQEEAILLIRCGTILRLVDLYQGEKGNIPPALIIRPTKNKSTDQNNTGDNTHTKMGDRNNRPNFLPLLSLLSVLIRSGNLPSESVFDVSDSDSDSDSSLEEKDKSVGNSMSAKRFSNHFITNNCMKVRQTLGLVYELPRRDTYFVSRRDLLESMLNEVALPGIKKDLTFSQSELCEVVCEIICHICYDDLEKTLTICALAQRVIKDRKAHESTVAVKVLSSLVHIRDKHFNQRIKSVTTTIFQGIEANLEYEKEHLLLLDSLHSDLINRTPGDSGFENEVCFHGIIIDNLDKFVSLFGQNITNCVKQKILGLFKSLLYIKKTPLSFDTSTCISVKTISLAYSGFSLEHQNLLLNEASCLPPKPGLSTNISQTMKKYLDEEIIKDKIFEAIKDLHMTVADAISTQCTQAKSDFIVSHGQHNILNHSQLLDSSTFSEYFAVLRQCLNGPKVGRRLKYDKHWIRDVIEYLLPVFWEVDNGGRNQNRSPADILKGEIIMFFEQLAMHDPNKFIQAFLDGSIYSSSSSSQDVGAKHASDPITKMMEVFITSNNNFDYNERYMVHFYNLLAFLGGENEHFYESVLSHENWKWALRVFVLNKKTAKPGRLYNVLLRNTITFVEDDEKFRKAMFNMIVACDGNESFLEQCSPDTAVLRLLGAIFHSELLQKEGNKDKIFCISKFVSGDCGGMSKISSVTKKVFSQLTDTCRTKDSPKIEKMLESLYYCINCMYSIMNALNTNEIKDVLREGWPEVDELNSIFTQIITMAEEEWLALYEKSEDARKYVAKIVSLSSDLQRLLISAWGHD